MSYNNFYHSINKTIIIEPSLITGSTPVISACTGVLTDSIISCSGDSQINLGLGYTEFNTDIIPDTNNTLSLGRPTKRFREINSLSGTTSVWVATTIVSTPNLNLGLDTEGYLRIINANNSIIEDDILNNGTY